MAKKRGLGQGLNALISDELEDEILDHGKGGTLNIRISNIEPNREQPRKVFEEDALHELADSISQYGIIQPLIVAKKDKYYEIIAGERRWRAAKIAGLKEIPVIIKDYSDEMILEVSLIENIQRENLNAIEEALAYQRLIAEFSLKQDEIAEKVSKSRSAIANTLRLLNLSNQVQQMIIDEMISSGHARALLAIEDQNAQLDIATRVFDEKLSVRETEKLIKNYLNPNKKIKRDVGILELDPIYKKIEDDVKKILGTKVSIIKKTEQLGKIEIEYYSKDELNRILELMHTISNQ
ncbi:site-specific DNA-binding protein [Petrocella atlantisensis]|uniref:Site-specific DNA-binding protein n=1 Tax=Petrocella atlantisensis TaxID=2173034 RepID=A0A3P7PFU5_9FIRM|nr:ParB/RepB/Spo0J family partition protein [Petrocella atlantisensis]VDN47768.1 site-specific DNA-binding protein [Petrocella atlantisensis]